MNTNMAGLGISQKSLFPCALDENSLTIGRVKAANVPSILSSRLHSGLALGIR